MITEGTYPYAVGGVSSWCDVVIGGLAEIDWEILPIVAGGKRWRENYDMPPNARLLRPIELWSQEPPPWSMQPWRRDASASIPARLLRGLLPWEADLDQLSSTLVQCRQRPEDVRRDFRSRSAWESYVHALDDVLSLKHEATAPAPSYDAIDAARLYQLLYWIARTAAIPTPPCDLVHVTAAGWAAVPAIVHKALYGTPVLLTEHGVYVREAYLASVRDASASVCERHMSTRIALGLTRAAYAAADVISPVTEANAAWERGLGVEPGKIRVIPNGIEPHGDPSPPPNINKVIVMGRIDPLKDVQTLLLVAKEVTRRMPEAQFELWGPPTRGEEVYAQACRRLHAQLDLGDRVRFMGRTTDPHGVIGSGDLVLMTSISEGMPMTLLEAMAQGRATVATSVGGVPDVLHGCGIVAAPGDVQGLATAVVTVLRNPGLSAALGRRGYERLHRRFTLARCTDEYRRLIHELTKNMSP